MLKMKQKQNTVKSSLAKRNIQKFCKNRMAVAGLIGVVIIVFACVFAPLLTPYSPETINIREANLPMSWEHPLGTDRMGRDMFARVLYGGRWSLFLGTAASFGANILAAILGCIAGYFGGKVDRFLVALQEFMSMFPTILVIMLITAVSGRSVALMLALWILTGWPSTMRVIRSRILSLKQEPYIESCRANGIGSGSIMFHHMVPNTLGPIIINCTMNISSYIMQESSLSFLGLGLPPEVATWGNILNGAKRIDILLSEPMLWIAPGTAILLITLCMSFFGDGLRDALDPTTR